MRQTIEKDIIFKKDNVLEIHSPLIKSGDHGHLTLVVEKISKPKKKISFLKLRGSGKGCYKTSKEADTFIRKERDKWE
jgi:hypothetical protein